MKPAMALGLLVLAVLGVACQGQDAPAVPAAQVDELTGSTLPATPTHRPVKGGEKTYQWGGAKPYH